MHTWAILNPHAGSMNSDGSLTEALKVLGEVEMKECQAPGDMSRLARQAVESGVERVLAVGGDGTINGVLNGIAPDFGRCTFGVVPLGTGNDFARAIAMPDDLNAAIAAIAANHTLPLDVARFESDECRYFINVSAGGFSGLVDEKMTEEMKRTWGPLAYLRSAAEALPEMKAYQTQIQFDDQPEETIEVFNVVVANGRFVAGGVPIAPEAMLDDGLLDVLIIPTASIAQLATLAPQIMLGQHQSNDLVITRRARSVKVRSTPGMWFNLDGELISNKPASFEIIPQALRVIVGEEQKA